MANEHNGKGSSRLDRMEALMERLIEDHLKFRDDLRQLLTAQVVLTDRVDKFASRIERFGDRLDRLVDTVEELAESQKWTDQSLRELAESQKRTSDSIHELRESQKDTDARLNTLIHVVDEWIRGTPPPPRP